MAARCLTSELYRAFVAAPVAAYFVIYEACIRRTILWTAAVLRTAMKETHCILQT